MRHANEKFENGQRVFDEDKAREDWGRAHIDDDGVVRWNSNNNVPFDDMLYDFMSIGVIGPKTAARSEEARHVDNERFFEEYRRNQPAQPSEEELFEMRAAFGEGTEVVDVISGRRVRL
mgnify:CR=1 FL=1